jgi:hypothetical protein
MPERAATFVVNAAPAALWAFIRDIQALGACVPGVERVVVIDATTVELTVQEKVGAVPMIVDLVATIEAETPPHSLRAVAHSEHLTMRIGVELRAAGERTELTTVFEVAGAGPLKPMVDRLFERRASERAAQFAASLEQRFGAPPVPSAEGAEAAAAENASPAASAAGVAGDRGSPCGRWGARLVRWLRAVVARWLTRARAP